MGTEGMTLEQAQERILELEGSLTEVTTERDSLLENNNQLSADNENLRKLNQKYFEKLTATVIKDEPKEDEEITSCEDFAKTINL